jgi:ferredoxin
LDKIVSENADGGTTMKVWVDQRNCIGNGVCAEIAPEVFVLGDNDTAFVCEDDRVLGGDAVASVPSHLERAVIEVVDECPAACVYIED